MESRFKSSWEMRLLGGFGATLAAFLLGAVMIPAGTPEAEKPSPVVDEEGEEARDRSLCPDRTDEHWEHDMPTC